jgi:hypothetical protein
LHRFFGAAASENGGDATADRRRSIAADTGSGPADDASGPPPPGPVAEPVPIPAYRTESSQRASTAASPSVRRPAGSTGWLRLVLALPVYFVVLWLVVIPSYPLPLLAKAALGFLLAGMAAGAVSVRRGWLAGLLGFSLVLVLALATVGLTLGVTGLGPAFLLNANTAHGETATVGKVRNELLQELLRLAVGAAALSTAGGAITGRLRNRQGS